MVAPIDVSRICNCDFPMKHRCVSFSESDCVFSQLTQVINCLTKRCYVKICGYCLTKLNKLYTTDMELVHKMDALRRENGQVLGILRGKNTKKMSK